MSDFLKLAAAVAGFLGLAACQATPQEDMPLEAHLLQHGYTIKGPAERVQAFRITGWHYIDRTHTILWANVRRPYLVTTMNPCDGLRYAETLAFTTTTGNLSRMETLLVGNIGGFPERCMIREIHELERLELAE